ncbi:MAG: hypothetical protein Tsb0010_17230 [Parvularculaceae bacterium]
MKNIALSSAIFAAACGPGASEAPRLASRIDACTLIDARAVSDALDLEMFRLPQSAPRGGGDGEAYVSSCAFMTVRGEAETMTAFRSAGQATLTVWSWREPEGAQSVLENYAARPGRAAEPVAGLGDEAFWNGATVLRIGRLAIVATVDAGLNPAADRAAERAIAEAALNVLRE